MIYRFLTTVLIFSTSLLYAQKIAFHGEVTDQNNEPIPYALLTISDSIKTQTDLDGHVHVNLESGNYSIKIKSLTKSRKDFDCLLNCF